MNVCYNLECKSLVCLSSLVKPSLWVKPGAYPRVEYLKFASLGQPSLFLANITLGWKGRNTLAYYVHS
jgi:hypothetical protein